MKILFLTSLYPSEWEEYFRKESKGGLQVQVNLFQQAIVRGLCENKVDFHLFCSPALGAFPINYKKLFIPKATLTIDGQPKGEMISYCNLMAYKAISIRQKEQKSILAWLKKNCYKDEKIVILTYNPNSPDLKACKTIKRKYPNVSVATIVTDLVDNMATFESNRRLLKRLQCAIEYKQVKSLYPQIDKFVLLSKQMEEKIPQAVGRSMVVEGIYGENRQVLQGKKDEKERLVLYTGGMDEYSGVRGLVEAFKKTTNPDFRLCVCGSGGLVSFVKEQSEKDKRIKYGGVVSHDEVVRMQARATCLINPRRPDQDITKYSFPSKTMEYMASATPMIGYHLEGMPEEYFPYMYTPKDLSEQALIETLEAVLTKPKEEMQAFGQRARQFILENKTAKQQVAKIIDFLK